MDSARATSRVRARAGRTGTITSAAHAKEQCATERTMCARLYLDLGVCFMSCVREVQWEAERWCGVKPEVTDTVRALHEGITGKYETAYGLTDAVDSQNGNWLLYSTSPADYRTR